MNIKFYGIYDLSLGSYYKSALDIFNNLPEFKIVDINSILELYNVLLFANNGVFDSMKPPHDLEESKKEVNKIIAKYFKDINEDNLFEISAIIHREYYLDFFELLVKYKRYLDINPKIFQKILEKNTIALYKFSRLKNLVVYLNDILIEHYKKNPSSVELILDHYESDNNGISRPDYYFPKSLLKPETLELLFDNYLNDVTEKNFNYLFLLYNSQKLSLSDRVKFKAQKKYDEFSKMIFNSASVVNSSLGISFAENQEAPYLETRSDKNLEYHTSYSLPWITENLDYPTLLNNFIYLFEFVDKNFRMTSLSKQNQLGALESFTRTKNKTSYLISFAFENIDNFSTLQMYSYYNLLSNNNIFLEDILEWFFKDYLTKEFGITNFYFEAPRYNSTSKEKCIAILPEFEKVFKQITHILKDGAIDQDFLFFSSQPIVYSTIPSSLTNKYVYPLSDKTDLISFHLFSDQSGIDLIEDSGSNHLNIFQHLIRFDYKLSDFHKHCTPLIEHFIKENIFTYDENEFLKIKNIRQISLLYSLYLNEFLHMYWMSDLEKEEIHTMSKNGLVRLSSSFLSEKESDYFNFYLNKSKFSNGYDLRNKYLHNSQITANDTEESHKINYMMILKLLVNTIIKLNDELILNRRFTNQSAQ